LTIVPDYARLVVDAQFRSLASRAQARPEEFGLFDWREEADMRRLNRAPGGGDGGY